MSNFASLKPPTSGTPITRRSGQLVVLNDPIIAFIEGEGVEPDIRRASVLVFDGAVRKACDGTWRLAWFEALAGLFACAWPVRDVNRDAKEHRRRGR